jgi:hypothetical protein
MLRGNDEADDLDVLVAQGLDARRSSCCRGGAMPCSSA